MLASLDFWVSRGVLLFTDEQGNTKFVPRAQRATAPEMPAQKPASPLPAAKPAVVHTLPTPEIPKPTMEQIAARLTPYGRQKRPRLRGLSDEELVPFMRRDMAAREPYYAQAQLTVDCTVMADDEVVVRILKWLEHGE